MKTFAKAAFMAAALVCLVPAASLAAIVDFTQDFESLTAADPDVLGNDGWLVYGTVFEGGTGNWLYGYGAYPAPNNPSAPAFCNIVAGEGGVEQGAQQLSVFSDYENATAHAAGDTVESSVFKEFIVEASDVGKVCTFSFSAKMGMLVPPSTAWAFIKTIDPNAGWAMTNLVKEDMTAIGTEWDGWTLELTIDEGLVGQYFQVGFSNKAASYTGSSIIYDNAVLSSSGGGPAVGITAYSQDFESLTAADPDALGDDGWNVYANVSDSEGTWLHGYGPYPAPNNPAAPAFSNIVTGEGGAEQGTQQMSVFSDYENASVHTTTNLIESIVYREMTVQSGDVGTTWSFAFQAKRPAIGGVAAPATAVAFIKTIDPASGYAITNYITQDMTTIATDWDGWTLSLAIDASLVGQFFQIGFSNTCSEYGPSSVIYDNVELYEDDTSAVPGNLLADALLRQNYPNPFNPQTRIEFSLKKAGRVHLAVYDVSGRLVTTLVNRDLDTGDHFVTWNGNNIRGAAAASGVYHYVMSTETGRTSRSMILLK